MLDDHDPIRQLLNASPMAKGDLWSIERTVAAIHQNRRRSSRRGLALVVALGAAVVASYVIRHAVTVQPALQTRTNGWHQKQVFEAGS